MTSTRSNRRLTASATRCCWAPSWMSRSSRRRSSSSATRTRRRDLQVAVPLVGRGHQRLQGHVQAGAVDQQSGQVGRIVQQPLLDRGCRTRRIGLDGQLAPTRSPRRSGRRTDGSRLRAGRVRPAPGGGQPVAEVGGQRGGGRAAEALGDEAHQLLHPAAEVRRRVGAAGESAQPLLAPGRAQPPQAFAHRLQGERDDRGREQVEQQPGLVAQRSEGTGQHHQQQVAGGGVGHQSQPGEQARDRTSDAGARRPPAMGAYGSRASRNVITARTRRLVSSSWLSPNLPKIWLMFFSTARSLR